MRPALKSTIGVVVAIVAAVVVVEQIEPIRPARDGRGSGETSHVMGPSALEEGGEVAGPLEPPFRPRRATPPRSTGALRPRSAAPAAPAPEPDPAALASAVGPLEAPPAGRRGDARSSDGMSVAGPERSPLTAPAPSEGSPPASADAPPPAPVLRPPVLLTPQARYPGEAQTVFVDRSRLTPEIRLSAAQGRVVLKVLVRTDGTVAEVHIEMSSGHAALDDAALRAAYGWHFEPAARDGQPIEAWVLIPVRFLIP